MECFDVCLTMPLCKITSFLNAKMFFYYTHCFKHVLRKTVFSFSYLVLIDIHMKMLKGLEGELDL